MTFLARQAFAKMFHSDPDDLDMHVIYDVSHNIAKVEVCKTAKNRYFCLKGNSFESVLLSSIKNRTYSNDQNVF